MSDDEHKEWEWEHAGFGRHRPALGLAKKVGQTFEAYMDELEAEQGKVIEADNEISKGRRRLMEHVTVQSAQVRVKGLLLLVSWF